MGSSLQPSFQGLLCLHSLLLEALVLNLQEAFEQRLGLCLPWSIGASRQAQGALQCLLKLDVVVFKMANKARDKSASKNGLFIGRRHNDA